VDAVFKKPMIMLVMLLIAAGCLYAVAPYPLMDYPQHHW
jgi:hypothetical protein